MANFSSRGLTKLSENKQETTKFLVRTDGLLINALVNNFTFVESF